MKKESLGMNTAKYLDRLLLKYSNTFNIYKPYSLGGRIFSAYGHFFSHNEKYVLVKEANMWSADSNEHIIFWEEEEITEEHIKEAEELIRNEMELQLVRKGQKLPEKNHMSSLLTIILLGEKQLSKGTVKCIKKFRFDKGYSFNMRGYARGRIVAVTMVDRNVTLSPDLRGSKKMFLDVFKEIEEGREGFDAVCEKQGVTCYTQE